MHNAHVRALGVALAVEDVVVVVVVVVGCCCHS